MPEGNMFARLCNPTTARRFKLRPFSHGKIYIFFNDYLLFNFIQRVKKTNKSSSTPFFLLLLTYIYFYIFFLYLLFKYIMIIKINYIFFTVTI
jgi:hypothetical protein